MNGEKYIFSESVVEAGTELYESFNQLKSLINAFYGDLGEPKFSDGNKLTKYEDLLSEKLQKFDK